VVVMEGMLALPLVEVGQGPCGGFGALAVGSCDTVVEHKVLGVVAS